MYIFKRASITFAALVCWSAALSLSAATFTPETVQELIDAIVTANANGENDTIDLGDNTFTLVAAAEGNNGLPIIDSDTNHSLLITNGVIQRSSAGATPNFRILEVDADANLSLDDVTLANGSVNALLNGGALLINPDGVVSLINNSRFVNNTASGDGGAISISTDASLILVQSSTFSDNSAVNGGAINQDEGGIFNVLADSTFDENDASDFGGAIAIGNGDPATLDVIRNSTFSGNDAENGGAIALLVAGATLTTLANSTIASNNATEDGGGIFVGTDAVIDTLVSNIVALNAADDEGEDIFSDGDIINASFNLIGTDGGHTITDGVDNNQVGADDTPLSPLLAPLDDNGGPTETRALLPGSPAINTGTNSLGLFFDQRGSGYLRERPLGLTDIGAFEIQDCTGIGDTDNDGVCDDEDNCPLDANEGQEDGDFDLVGDACDNCVLDPNHDQNDGDVDGIGDVCDECMDTDGDGVGDPGFDNSGCDEEDEDDNCPFAENADQNDLDDDGIGDECDTIPGGVTVIPVPPPPPILPALPPPGLFGPDVINDYDVFSAFDKAPQADIPVEHEEVHDVIASADHYLPREVYSDEAEEDLDVGAGGCSSTSGAGQSATNVFLITFLLLWWRRMRVARLQKQTL